jgi:streptogramin lyase/subtilisin-like proprotein convertase family protein
MGVRDRGVGVLLGALAAWAIWALPAAAATPVAVEFTDNISNGQQGVAAGPDGNLWYAEGHNVVVRVTPAGVATEFDTGLEADASLRGIAVGSDGFIWVTESNSNEIAKIDPNNPVAGFTEYTIPTAASEPWRITAGSDGNLWFTENAGDKIGRITTAGMITEFTPPTAGSEPRGITVGSDGNIWFAEHGVHKLGRIDPMNTAAGITEFPIPAAFPWDLTTGPDRMLWITNQIGNAISRFDPNNTAAGFTAFTVGLSPSANPIGIAPAMDGNIWFTETGDDRVGRITPAGAITEFTAGITNGVFPSFGIAAGPDGNLWFSEQNLDQVGRINTALDPPAFSNPAQITLPAPVAGAGTPYPSAINVSGLQGTVTGVTVRLFGISHKFVEDIEALLVGPQGQSVKLVSDVAFVGSLGGSPTNGVSLTLTDAGPNQLPPTEPLVSGVYRPTDLAPAGEVLPGPAPGPPYSSTLAAFNGTAPNGTWQLYVADDFGPDPGAIHRGWGLDVATTGPPPVATPAPSVTPTKRKKCKKKRRKRGSAAVTAKKRKCKRKKRRRS